MPAWLVDPAHPLPALAEIEAARERMRGLSVRTPLLALHGAEWVWIKPEVLQPTGSFKLRGIGNAVAAIGDEARAAGVSIVSSGNAAQALAWSARRFGVPARAIMPATTPRAKVDNVIALGAVADLRDPATVWEILRQRTFLAEPGAFIHPTADRHVVAGYGAIALEILEDLPEVEVVYVPVGGGGLIGGIAAAFAHVAPSVQVVGVQPAGCTPVIQSLAAGTLLETTCDTFCDGVAGTFVDPDTWPLLRALPLGWTTVTDAEAAAEIRRLALGNRLVAEGSGALAPAAARLQAAGRTAVAIVSGGSIDAEKLASFLSSDA